MQYFILQACHFSRGYAYKRDLYLKANLHQKSKDKDVSIFGKKAKEPVTDGDLLSHRAMHLGITHEFPGIKVVSEEKDTSQDKKYGECSRNVT